MNQFAIVLKMKYRIYTNEVNWVLESTTKSQKSMLAIAYDMLCMEKRFLVIEHNEFTNSDFPIIRDLESFQSYIQKIKEENISEKSEGVVKYEKVLLPDGNNECNTKL